MAFVEVAHLRVDTEDAKQSPSHDAQHLLLLQAKLLPAAVKLAGDTAINRRIRGVIGIEQIQAYAADLYLPGADPKLQPRYGDRQPQPVAACVPQGLDGQLPGIVVRI